ncbi:MAG: flavin reductase family protein [Deltaproteobacteria bacterium]|nr:flavin reductase family protein [Deltaproteobacteria bacterium]
MDPQTAEAFRHIPYGIYVLATKRHEQTWAMIASWVSQISYSPPLLLVALRHNRPAIPVIQESGFFSLALLKREQKQFVPLFKHPIAQPMIEEFFIDNKKEGAPYLKDALASWVCSVWSSFPVGDHVLFIGEVQSALSNRRGEPLTTAAYGKTYIGQS